MNGELFDPCSTSGVWDGTMALVDVTSGVGVIEEGMAFLISREYILSLFPLALRQDCR